MTIQWGADSLLPLDSAYNGTTVADHVINHYYAGEPHDQIVFWGRYFTNTYYPQYTWRGDGEARALVNAVRGYRPGGTGWVVPIDVPDQNAVGGGYGAGYAEGATFAGAITAALSTIVSLPGSQVLHVYLDIENGSLISTAYWQGWASAVNNHRIGTAYPLYACAYLGSIGGGTGTANAATIAAAQVSLATKCYGVWSNQPQLAGGLAACSSPGPAWGPSTAAGLPALMWQYGDAGVCKQYYGLATPVDLNATDPATTGPYGNGECDHMLWCHL
jgi:hypothetical protein